MPFSQLLRIKHKVDDPVKYNVRKEEMGKTFLDTGYPKRLVQEHTHKMDELDWSTILQKKTLIRKQDRIPFISTYDQSSTYIAKIMGKHWNIMRKYYEKIKIFNDLPLLSLRGSSNLKDRLVKTDMSPKFGNYGGRLGCFPCMACDNCSLLIKGPIFKHPNTGDEF